MMNRVRVARVSSRRRRARAEQLAIGQALVAQLQHVHTGGDQRSGQLLEGGQRVSAVDQHVKPGRLQTLQAIAGDADGSLQRVDLIAELF